MRSTHGGTAATARLAEAVAALAAVDLTGVDDAVRLAELRELWPVLGGCRAQFARRVEVVHRTGSTRHDGAVSTVAWLRAFLRQGAREACWYARVGVQLQALPDTAAAFTAGRISLAHVAAI